MCAKKELLVDDRPAEPSSKPLGGELRRQALVKAEANLLRFPLFALSTKGLKTLDGMECHGVLRRDGQEQTYTLRVTRNTASLYPGPLARRVHFALLALATERGFPVTNPITWTWRDLCRRMGIGYGGQTTLRHLKAAIQATHGVVIHTQSALISRVSRAPLPSVERGYHLYQSYTFAHEPTDDGGTADRNAVWFADWYLDNLNSFYAAPLDYSLWQTLDRSSPIASRLYEFLLLSFHSGTPLLRINYPYLARLLPVRPERYPSLARKQMGPALDLLRRHGLLSTFAWVEGRQGQMQLHFRAGARLLARPARADLPEPASSGEKRRCEEAEDAVQVQEIRSSQSPGWFLVRKFNGLWGGSTFARPTPKEIQLAGEVIARHGETRAALLVERAVKRLKTQWPEAKTFGALARYLPEAEADLARAERRAERERQERQEERLEQEAVAQRQAEKHRLERHWKPVWEAMSEVDRRPIAAAVEATWPYYRRIPHLFLGKCLEELARQQKTGEAAALEDAASPDPGE